jgi:MHS family proline/betaine transporter-like MFS transporter
LHSGNSEVSAPRWTTISAVILGNALEWYEIVIFGYLATVISRLFFPAHSPSVSLLLVFASFGLTYVSRPLGAVLLGLYADRFGRKVALRLSIWIMAVASIAIVLAPTYGSIGIVAPVIIVVARLLQGFSAGGEFGSATAFLAEQDSGRRGYLASWQFASQGITEMLATGSITALTLLLSAQQIESWGWRLPFLFGLVLAPVAIYIRAKLSETPEFRQAQTVREKFDAARSARSLAVAIGLIMLGTVVVYTIIFLPTYAMHALRLSAAQSFAAGILTGALQLAFVPLFGALSDRIGRTTAPIAAALVILLGAWPALTWLNHDTSVAKLLTLQALIGIIAAAYLGPMPALLAELFPVRARSTGLSISYAVGVAVFGGIAPLIHAWLILVTGNPAAPALYIVAAAIVSLVALAAARRRQSPAR